MIFDVALEVTVIVERHHSLLLGNVSLCGFSGSNSAVSAGFNSHPAIIKARLELHFTLMSKRRLSNAENLEVFALCNSLFVHHLGRSDGY